MVKKILISFGLSVMVLLVIGVFATAADLEVVDEIEEVVDEFSIGDISEEVVKYVETFVDKRDIAPTEISSIIKVDFNDLPKEVNIENVGDHNLAIYEIDYTDSVKGEDKIFVVTYSVEELKAQGDLIIAHDKRQFLNFGFDGEMTEGFLETATGVEGSLEKGYVMVRSGSITAISTNLEVIAGSAPKEGVPSDEGKEQIEIIIYKNGEQIGFGNTIIADSIGVKEDYDVQSNGVVTFGPGDVISVYVDASEELAWKDVITMIEITTTN